MEVHAHTHPAPAAHRKNWTHYLWEFLMLFLAVFCGFLAEYQLEHKIEKDRERQYIGHLVEDLCADTVILSESIYDLEAHLRRNDSLIRLLTSDAPKEYGADLYYLGRHASRGPRLAVSDPTYQQLKNSGGLRLISRSDVSRAVIEYYSRMVFINYLQDIANEEAREYRGHAINIFHPVIFNEQVRPDNSIIRPEGNPALMTYEKPALLKLAGMVSYIKNTKMGLKLAEEEMKKDCIRLIELIKKEYRIR